MRCRFGTTIAAVTFCSASSLALCEVAFSQRNRDYSAREMQVLLRGFGYDVTPRDTLTDEATKKAIADFQQGYKLTPVDGTANAQTQNLAADLVKILQINLNLVVKLNPPLPRNQFYGPRTEAAVRQFQKQLNLEETGIANLPLRQRLDQEAKKILGIGGVPTRSTPTPTPSFIPSPGPIRRISTPTP